MLEQDLSWPLAGNAEAEQQISLGWAPQLHIMPFLS